MEYLKKTANLILTGLEFVSMIINKIILINYIEVIGLVNGIKKLTNLMLNTDIELNVKSVGQNYKEIKAYKSLMTDEKILFDERLRVIKITDDLEWKHRIHWKDALLSLSYFATKWMISMKLWAYYKSCRTIQWNNNIIEEMFNGKYSLEKLICYLDKNEQIKNKFIKMINFIMNIQVGYKRLNGETMSNIGLIDKDIKSLILISFVFGFCLYLLAILMKAAIRYITGWLMTLVNWIFN